MRLSQCYVSIFIMQRRKWRFFQYQTWILHFKPARSGSDVKKEHVLKREDVAKQNLCIFHLL